MSKVSRSLLSFAVTAMIAQAAAAAELSVNGGFETGTFSGWTQFPAGSQEIVTPGFGSTFAARLFNTNTAAASLIKNANVGIGQVNPGDTLTISFDAKGTFDLGGVAFAEFFSELSGGGVSATEILGFGPLNGGASFPTWTHFSFTTTAGFDVSGGVTLQLSAITGGAPGSSAEVFYDNISITVGSVVADPTWISNNSGDYFVASNWQGSNIPNGVDAIANFSTPIGSGTRFVYANDTYTLGTLRFNSPNTYELNGQGLTLSSTTTALIDVVTGTPKINLPTTFASSTDINLAAGTRLTFADPITIASGKTITVNGPALGTGTLTIQAPFNATGPANLKINTNATVNLDYPNPDGNLTVNVDPATLNVGANQSFASLVLDLGGNTVNVGQNSGGAPVAATLAANTVVVSNGTGNVLNTVSAGNSVTSNNLAIDNTSGLTKQGPGTLAVKTVTGNGALAIADGTVRLTTGNTASVVGSLSISGTSKLDLTDNALIVRNGDLAALRSAAATGLGGTSGLLSSDASPAAHTTVAVFLNDAGGGVPYYSSFGLVSGLSSTDVITRYTYVGDTNLDGVLNATDLANVLEGYSTGQVGWQWGDVDYSGAVTALDVATFLAAYNLNLPSLGFPSGGATSGGAIPEPAALGLLVPVGSLLARRRRF